MKVGQKSHSLTLTLFFHFISSSVKHCLFLLIGFNKVVTFFFVKYQFEIGLFV